MAMDGLLIARVVKELQKVKGAKIGKIQNLSAEEVLFFLHSREYGPMKMDINVHANSCKIVLCRKAKDLVPAPSPFVMVLRKTISQGIITEIEQAGFDRIVRFKIEGFNEFGDKAVYNMYAELMGKYANLILCDENNTIIDCLKRIPVFENSKRLIHPGARYELPEKPDKQNPLTATDLDLNASLTSQVEGFSPQLSKEFLIRLNRGEDYQELVQQFLNSDTLYIRGKDFQAIPFALDKGEVTELPLMEGLESLFDNKDQSMRIQELNRDVFRTAKRELSKHKKKLEKLEDSLEQSKNYDQYRKYGDLLFGYLYLKKEPVLKVEDYETGEMVEIPIDMRYDLKTNANLYYKKYRKLKRGLDMLQEQITTCEREIDYYTQLNEQLEYASMEDVAEIRTELESRRVLKPQKNNARKKKKKIPGVLHLRLENADIYAGKNNLQNDWLTFDFGRRNDLWFHVKDWHGSHVLLQCEEPDESLIRLCASLAAYYSKARHSSSVPVDYTTISQLKKIPKKEPGFAAMKTYKTIYIDPDCREIEQTIEKYKV